MALASAGGGGGGCGRRQIGGAAAVATAGEGACAKRASWLWCSRVVVAGVGGGGGRHGAAPRVGSGGGRGQLWRRAVSAVAHLGGPSGRRELRRLPGPPLGHGLGRKVRL